ncbi:39S ribosomal protein L51, mitochondrial [Lates japonicus]|uniref:39S ribosomal protein L51, mitochondrial n=1 Tax=Lates japonicus TaxID=270547 RepID=A0AAD3N2D5_LATJO|nr:39S ribosomal protein L51, mitochondrial [Lates japonicus]
MIKNRQTIVFALLYRQYGTGLNCNKAADRCGYRKRRTFRTISTGTCCQIRMHAIPPLKKVDRWTEKRSMFGVYDNIGILGDFKAHPKDLIVAPCWLKGFKGIELLRLIRKKKMPVTPPPLPVSQFKQLHRRCLPQMPPPQLEPPVPQELPAQVEEVVDIMRVNVDKVLERDQKLSELDDRADALQAGASQFESCAAKLKNKYWWKNCKMMIMMGIIGVIVVGIIFLYFFY